MSQGRREYGHACVGSSLSARPAVYCDFAKPTDNLCQEVSGSQAVVAAFIRGVAEYWEKDFLIHGFKPNPINIYRGPALDATTLRTYTRLVRFEWDEAKREANIRKHGITSQESRRFLTATRSPSKMIDLITVSSVLSHSDYLRAEWWL